MAPCTGRCSPILSTSISQLFHGSPASFVFHFQVSLFSYVNPFSLDGTATPIAAGTRVNRDRPTFSGPLPLDGALAVKPRPSNRPPCTLTSVRARTSFRSGAEGYSARTMHGDGLSAARLDIKSVPRTQRGCPLTTTSNCRSGRQNQRTKSGATRIFIQPGPLMPAIPTGRFLWCWS